MGPEGRRKGAREGRAHLLLQPSPVGKTTCEAHTNEGGKIFLLLLVVKWCRRLGTCTGLAGGAWAPECKRRRSVGQAAGKSKRQKDAASAAMHLFPRQPPARLPAVITMP